MKFNLSYFSSLLAMESWRSRNADKDSDGLKNEAERWKKRDEKIEDSSWKRREPERRDIDKWRRSDDSDRWKKDTADKWRKDDNYDRDDLRDRDRLDNRGFDKRDDRDRDRDRGMDGRGVSIHSQYKALYYIFNLHNLNF